MKHLRHGRFGAALDYVLDPTAKDHSPLTVLTLLTALRHRSALREALEGRSSMSNPNLAAAAASARVPSISTLDHGSAVTAGDGYGFSRLTQTRSRGQQRAKPRPGEVKDVLNKLGIGRQNGNAVLKSSFPAIQRTTSRYADIPTA